MTPFEVWDVDDSRAGSSGAKVAAPEHDEGDKEGKDSWENNRDDCVFDSKDSREVVFDGGEDDGRDDGADCDSESRSRRKGVFRQLN